MPTRTAKIRISTALPISKNAQNRLLAALSGCRFTAPQSGHVSGVLAEKPRPHCLHLNILASFYPR